MDVKDLSWLIWFIPLVSLFGTAIGAFVSVKIGLNGTKDDIKSIRNDLNCITNILSNHSNEIGNLQEKCNIEFPGLKKRLDKLENKFDKM